MTRNDVLPDPTSVVSTDGTAAAPTSAQIVRQAIYDAAVKVVGYELIVHGDDDASDADAVAANTVGQIGLNLVAGGAAWVPLSRGFLFGGHAAALPPDRIVFEVEPELGNDPEALAAIGRLKAQGHGIAIDPFTAGDDVMPLLAMANAVKLDGTLDRATLAEHSAAARRAGAQVVAKNVESHESFETLKDSASTSSRATSCASRASSRAARSRSTT